MEFLILPMQAPPAHGADPADNPPSLPAWPLPKIPPPEWDAIIPFASSDKGAHERRIELDRQIQGLDLGALRTPIRSILVLKLDHFGDFVIGLPALHSLRQAFPEATIRLVCGRWNERSALNSGLVDEVRCFNFFPERPRHEGFVESDPLSVFDEAAAGRYDVAIDLRVDEDTRQLLGRVDAKLRCGIGSVFQFPLLDIALPHEHAIRANVGVAAERYLLLPPDRFNSNLPHKGPLHHFGPLTPGDVLYGPYTELPRGRLLAEFGLTVRGYLPLRPASIMFEVIRDGGQTVAAKVFGRRTILQLRSSPVSFEFDNLVEGSRFEFRVRVQGRPAHGTVQFSGVTVHQMHTAAVARFRPAELHIGEKLSLLVALVRERTADLYRDLIKVPTQPHENTGNKAQRVRIAVAPFSNSTIRSWPAEYYARLIALLLERGNCEVILLGADGQVDEAEEMLRDVESEFVQNLVGKTSWTGLQQVLTTADLVICNNSGIAHQAAALGGRVLAIYSGSHQPQEWGPRGMHAQTLMHLMPCSPCGFESLVECPADHACMRLITPEYVLAQAEAALARHPSDLPR